MGSRHVPWASQSTAAGFQEEVFQENHWEAADLTSEVMGFALSVLFRSEQSQAGHKVMGHDLPRTSG